MLLRATLAEVCLSTTTRDSDTQLATYPCVAPLAEGPALAKDLVGPLLQDRWSGVPVEGKLQYHTIVTLHERTLMRHIYGCPCRVSVTETMYRSVSRECLRPSFVDDRVLQVGMRYDNQRVMSLHIHLESKASTEVEGGIAHSLLTKLLQLRVVLLELQLIDEAHVST